MYVSVQGGRGEWGVGQGVNLDTVHVVMVFSDRKVVIRTYNWY